MKKNDGREKEKKTKQKNTRMEERGDMNGEEPSSILLVEKIEAIEEGLNSIRYLVQYRECIGGRLKREWVQGSRIPMHLLNVFMEERMREKERQRKAMMPLSPEKLNEIRASEARL